MLKSEVGALHGESSTARALTGIVEKLSKRLLAASVYGAEPDVDLAFESAVNWARGGSFH
jgi:hypothetical protein